MLHGFGTFFKFTNCTFTNNHGRQTGVMTVEDGDATFENCQFLTNKGDQVTRPLARTCCPSLSCAFVYVCLLCPLTAVAGHRLTPAPS